MSEMINGKKRILILEDDKEIREIENDALVAAGYTTFLAGTSLQAYEILENNKIDVIVLDLRLPNIDGQHFLKKIRLEPETANIPVLVCSASAHKIDVIKCAQYGIEDYVVKPFSIKSFVKKIENIVNGVDIGEIQAGSNQTNFSSLFDDFVDEEHKNPKPVEVISNENGEDAVFDELGPAGIPDDSLDNQEELEDPVQLLSDTGTD